MNYVYKLDPLKYLKEFIDDFEKNIYIYISKGHLVWFRVLRLEDKGMCFYFL